MENYTVYKHTFPNGKVYIGITKREPKVRWGSSGHGYCRNIRMWNAIKKYGWNNIEHIILYENKTREEADELERKLIEEYKSNQKDFGYNIQRGGVFGSSSYFDENYIVKLFEEGLSLQEVSQKVGCCTRTASEILRKNGVAGEEIIRRGRVVSGEKGRTPLVIRNKIISLFKEGKKLTEIIRETDTCYTVVKRVLSENNITHSDIMNNYYILEERDAPYIKNLIESNKTIGEIANELDCSHSTVSLFIRKYLPELLSKVQKNRYSRTVEKSSKRVEQYSLNGEYLQTFSSLAEALRQVAPQSKPNYCSHIIQCCQKKRKSAYGFIWKYEDDNEKISAFSTKAKHPVIQYDLEGNFIRIFDSVKAAAEAVNTVAPNIQGVCSGKKKTARGYKWAYVNEEHKQTHKREKQVSQYSKEGILLQTFSSIKEASQKTNIRYDSISATCREKQKTAGGFIWKYKE